MVRGLRHLAKLRAVRSVREKVSQAGSSEQAAYNKWPVVLGRLLALAGGVFVLERLWRYRDGLNVQLWAWQDWASVAALACAYAVINGLLALGWHHLLRHRSERQSLVWSLGVYALTQLSKYIPGNVFQFAGRQIMGGTAGLGQKSLLYSSAMEILFLVLAALCFVPVLLPVAFPGVLPYASAGLAALLLLALPPCVHTMGGRRLGIAATAYATFVVLSGAIFLGVLTLCGGQLTSGHDALTVVGAFVISWLAGLLTPGAPAGIGVREAILLLLLDDLVAESVVVTSVVTGRVVTTIGDVVFFGIGLLVGGSNGPSRGQAGPRGN